MPRERTIRADGVEIATEAFGDPRHPPVLLIMGVMASMLWWPEAFCERLAARGLRVIRYDNRDTGLSTTYEPGNPSYSFDDMVDDAVRVLDGYGIGAAHVAGMSMGGMIAQLVALRHPDRVISLTAISTSPVGTDTSDLPGMSDAYAAHASEGEEVDWSSRDQVVASIVKDVRMLAGSAFPHDEAGTTALVKRDFDRAKNFASSTNHFILKSSDEWQGRLGEMRPPLLVIHGTADLLFPIEHGIALSTAVKGASLIKLEGGGHEINPGHWDRIVAAIADHATNAS